MVDDPIVTILADHGQRLTTIESDLNEIKTGIQDIKDGPMFALDARIKEKVREAGGVLSLLVLALFFVFNQ
jgi:hypothetical protein